MNPGPRVRQGQESSRRWRTHRSSAGACGQVSVGSVNVGRRVELLSSDEQPAAGDATRRLHARPRALSPLAIGALLLGLGTVALLAFYVSLPAAAIVYAVGYVLLTWIRPELALLLMFAAAPFPHDLGGGPVKTALAEINLVLATPVLAAKAFFGHRRLTRNPLKWPILAYFVVCIFSSLLNGITTEGFISMAQMALYLIIAVFVFSSCVNRLRLFQMAYYGLLLSAMFLALIAVATRAQYILGIHKNALGTNLSYAVVICGELWFAEPDRWRKRWWGLLACVLMAGLFFSLSRGAWLGAVAGLGVIALARRQVRVVLSGTIVVVVVMVACWHLLADRERQYAADLAAESHNIKARLVSIDYAMRCFERSPVLGVGVGLRKQYDATNVIMSTLAETGVLGLATFASVFLALLLAVWKPMRYLSRSDPWFSILIIGAALCACEFVHGCADHYWSRTLLPVWASVGMTLFVCDQVRRCPSR